jgi:hypothetical protein
MYICSTLSKMPYQLNVNKLLNLVPVDEGLKKPA